MCVCMQCVHIGVCMCVCVHILTRVWIQILWSSILHIQFHLALFSKLIFWILHWLRQLFSTYCALTCLQFVISPQREFPASWINNRCWMWGCWGWKGMHLERWEDAFCWLMELRDWIHVQWNVRNRRTRGLLDTYIVFHLSKTVSSL